MALELSIECWSFNLRLDDIMDMEFLILQMATSNPLRISNNMLSTTHSMLVHVSYRHLNLYVSNKEKNKTEAMAPVLNIYKIFPLLVIFLVGDVAESKSYQDED